MRKSPSTSIIPFVKSTFSTNMAIKAGDLVATVPGRSPTTIADRKTRTIGNTDTQWGNGVVRRHSNSLAPSSWLTISIPLVAKASPSLAVFRMFPVTPVPSTPILSSKPFQLSTSAALAWTSTSISRQQQQQEQVTMQEKEQVW